MVKKFTRSICYLLVVAVLSGFVPWADLGLKASADGGTVINSATVVDLDELLSHISAEEAALDTDGDGLCDQIERIIGTNLELTDTDKDGLDDYFEAENGLDPLKYDTNDDGINDLVELTGGSCSIAYEALSASADTDGDGIPNVSDSDNDGDGVGDAVDISPFSATSAGDSQKITVTTTGKATFVKLQISPADVEKLYENNQILNWPVDKYGQICDFDGSENDMTIIPMLEVSMNDYPDEATCEAYGYVRMDGYMLVPLQQLQDDAGLVGLSATVYLPENTGTPIGGGQYSVTMTLKLTWSLSMLNDNIVQDWSAFGTVRYNGKAVKLEDFDYMRDKEYLGCDIGDLNGNGKPDLAIFWCYSWHSYYDGRLISNVHVQYYYDLVYDSKNSVYNAQSASSNVLNAYYDLPGYKNKEGNENAAMKVLNGRFNISIEDGKISTCCYSGADTLSVGPTVKSYTYNLLRSIRGDAAKGFISLGAKEFYSVGYISYNEYNPIAYPSNIRDSYYLYDDGSDTVWYLYETYNSGTGKNALIMKRSYKNSYSYYQTETQVLLNGLPADAQSDSGYHRFRDLDHALSVNIYDFNGDGKDDMLLTDRSGGMYIITDCNRSGWQNRMISIPDSRAKTDIEGKSTKLFDFNQDGHMDLVGVEAVRSNNYWNTDLTFQIGIRDAIAQGSKFISKEYVPFSIIGLQAEEANGTSTVTVYGGTTSALLNLSVTLENTYLYGDLSADETVSEYVAEVRDGAAGFSILDGSYNHIFSAVMDITYQIESDIAKNYSQPKPIVILAEERNRYLNMDDLIDTAGYLALNVAGEDLVAKRQMLVKWAKNGTMLSQYEINDMVDSNPYNIRDFTAAKDDVKENLSRWNLGEVEITGIGEDYIAALSQDMKVYYYDISKKPLQTFTAIKLLFARLPVQTVANVGWQFQAKLARFNALNRIGKVLIGVGVMVDIACAIHSGILYGQAMAKVGGTTFGIVTGVTYGTLLFSVAALSLALTFAGPVGYVMIALMAVDGILAFFFDGYESIIAKAINAVMNLLYSSKQYPGTEIYDVSQTPSNSNNKVTTQGTQMGYSLGATVNAKSEYVTGVRASSSDTPANTRDDVSDCYANLSIWNMSNAVTTNYSGTQVNDSVYWKDGIWYHDKTFRFDNTLTFDRPGMNLPVFSFSCLDYRLIEKVTVTRYVVYTDYDYDYDSDSISSGSISYYDVVPNDLATFFTAFNFLATDTEPSASFNQITKLDADGDGLLISGDHEVDKSGNPVDSDPNSRDTDGDKLADNLEAAYGTSPRNPDSDGDGLTDYEEVILGTDPNRADTDSDGVSDYTEVKTPVHITITPYGGSGGVSAQAYSNPFLADTDSDGLGDKYERDNGYNPASKCTAGNVRWDENEYDPSFKQGELPDCPVSAPGDVVTLDLNDNFEDLDGDELVFDASIGAIDDQNVWTYTFDPAQDGKVVSVVFDADDLRGGVFSDDIVVYDCASPVVVKVTADSGGQILKGTSITDFGNPVKANTTFTLQFNEEFSVIGNLGDITITPVSLQEFDADASGNALSAAVTAVKASADTLTVTRNDALVENGVGYELRIPAGMFMDTSDNVTDEDYILIFKAVDTIPPVITSFSHYADLITPIVITFNEWIRPDLGASMTVTDGVNIFDLPIKRIGDKTIEVWIPSNVLQSNTVYYLCSFTFSGVYVIPVRDKGHNLHYQRTEDIPVADVSFTTGDVSGPEFSSYIPVYSKTCGVAGIADGKIEIVFSEDICRGEEFDDIKLSYGPSISLWYLDSARDQIKKYGPRFDISIQGNKLVIDPSVDMPFDSQMGYAVYIPLKALRDAAGNYLREKSAGDFCVIAYAGNAGLVKPAARFIAAPGDLSVTGIVEAMLRSTGYCSTLPIDPGQFVAVGFQTTVTAADGGVEVDGLTVVKLDEEDNETPVPVDLAVVPAIEYQGLGSYVVLLKFKESLEAGCTYKLYIAANSVKNAVGLLKNDYQEMTFTTGVPSEFNGGTDFTESDFYGRLRAGEKLWASSKYKKYMDMVGGDIAYQWYRGDTNDPAAAAAIDGATDLVYEPANDDVGKFLYLKLTLDRKDGTAPVEVMSPALGPVEAAYLTDPGIQSISVKNGETELLGAFDSGQREYDISVPTSVDSVRVSVGYDEALGSNVMINGIPSQDWVDGGLTVPLDLGNNVVIVHSAAENYLSFSGYIIRIYRSQNEDDTGGQVKPEAWFVKIANDDDFYTGKTLNGAYKYFDVLGRDEDQTAAGTSYQWYRMDDPKDENPAAIAGATGQTYALTQEDAGKYVYFAVIPRASGGSAAGDAQQSQCIGPIRQVDDGATSITGISVAYKGQELLSDFDPAQKTYKLNFKSDKDDSTVTVTVTGSDITINGTPTASAVVDFYQDSLVEVRDTAAGSSCFIKLNSMPFAAAARIEGEGTVTVTGTGDGATTLSAIAYDQYGEPLSNVAFAWDVPDGYDYSVGGAYGQLLYIAADSSTPAGTIEVTARVQDNSLVFGLKDVVFVSGVATDTDSPYLSDGTITPSGITSTGVTLNWTKATDNVSAQDHLEYLVYRSDSDNIGSVDGAETNGTAVGSYSADIDTKDITGLDADKTYYFNVVVKDEAGNKTAYAAAEVTTNAVTYTVTYDPNGGTGTAPTETNKVEGAQFSAKANTFTAPTGKQFLEWNTSSDGLGTGYAPGASVTMPGHALTLYAVWEDIPAVTYTVTYDPNGGTGSAPTETNKAEGAQFSAAANTFTAPSGKQFLEWNTSSDGLGTGYAPSATVTMPGHALTLYAVWEDIPTVTYSVTYDPNGGTGTAPTETNKAEGAQFSAAANTFTAPSGKQFLEWNTASNGLGTGYAPNATVTMPGHALTLYAVWEDIPAVTYTVTYDPNGGTGSAPTETNKAEGAQFSAKANTFTAPTGKQFLEWNTSSDGLGTGYAPGATVTMPGHTLTLYAIWEDIPAVTYSVTYDPNGGTGSAPTETNKTEGAQFSAKANTFTAPTGKQFLEWNTSSDGLGTGYAPGATVTMPGHTLTLYAIWEDIPAVTYSVTYDPNGGTGSAPTETNKAEGAQFSAAANTFTAPSGKQFLEWNTSSDGLGTGYAPGATVTMPGHALTLYAIWEDIPAVTYSVTYDPNGGTGTAPTETNKAEGAQFSAKANTFMAPSGKRFLEWNTASDGLGTGYAPGATVTMPGHTLTLYAVWEDDIVPSSNADLSALLISEGILSPEFDPAVTEYSATVAHGVSVIGVTPITADSKADVTVNGTTAASGSAAYIGLNVGTNYINIAVTAEDGRTATIYTITIYRQASNDVPAPEQTVDILISGIAVTVNCTFDPWTGTYTVNLDGNVIVNALMNAPTDSMGNVTVSIAIPEHEGARAYITEIPAYLLQTARAAKYEIITPIGTVTVPGNMLTNVDDIGAATAGISIAAADTSGLDPDVRAQIGNRPIVALSLILNGSTVSWENPNAPVTVTIPYTPAPEELLHPGSIVVWYIDGSGNAISVPNGQYDAMTGTVTFTTTHFSRFAVAYNIIGFADVAADAWYREAVEFIAARGITTGTGDGHYSPERNLTRAEFLVMMMRAYEIEADTDLSGNFSDAGNTWYTGYLAAAKRLGISAGVGNNLFAPDKPISRQEMFTLLYNALGLLGKLPYGTAGRPISAFGDADKIPPWAREAMALFAQTGIISGSGGLLFPEETSTRAQMAQVLYNLLG